MGQKVTLAVVIFLVIFAPCAVFSQEQITITTYYPSPFGSYRELRTDRMVVDPVRNMPTADGSLRWGGGKGELSPDQGSSLELGGSGTPYIDIANDISSDYDFRIILNGNDDVSLTGAVVSVSNNAGNPGRVRTYEVYYCSSY